METKCVRCNNTFKQQYHPMAHFFTICYQCRDKYEETINDQTLYNFRELLGR